MNISKTDQIPAAVAYIPVIGWVFIFLFYNRSEFAMFHLKQSIGLFLFLAGALIGWMVVTWALSWIPFGMLLGVFLFTIVMVAAAVGIVSWVIGVANALLGRIALLPVFGEAANRLPL